MSMKNEWTKIMVARIVEGVLTAGAFVAGLWGITRSRKLEESLDKKVRDEEEIENET